MNRLFLALVLQSCACVLNPSLEMWESADRGAPNACMPFGADGGVGFGAIDGGISVALLGANHFAFSPRSSNGLAFLTLQLDEAGTTCHLSSVAESNRALGLRTIVISLAAPIDAGFVGSYQLGRTLDGGGTGTAMSTFHCTPFLGLLGDCTVPVSMLEGTVTVESVSGCELAGRLDVMDPVADAGSIGRFSSVYCRGFD